MAWRTTRNAKEESVVIDIQVMEAREQHFVTQKDTELGNVKNRTRKRECRQVLWEASEKVILSRKIDQFCKMSVDLFIKSAPPASQYLGDLFVYVALLVVYSVVLLSNQSKRKTNRI
jgi:hypothetical protein